MIVMYRDAHTMLLLVTLSLVSAALGCQYKLSLDCRLSNGTTVIVTRASFCCNGQLHARASNGQQQCCCHDNIQKTEELYQPDEHLCCLGGKYPRTDDQGRPQACCGAALYPAVNGNLCCAPGLEPYTKHELARLYTRDVDDSDICCGTEKINQHSKVCCRDEHDSLQVRSYDRDSRRQCCQTDYYNTATHECELEPTTGRYQTMLKYIRLCGNFSIDTRIGLCCDSHYQEYPSDNAPYTCCGTNLINENTQHCCMNTFTVNKGMVCCGTHPTGMDTTVQRCCQGQPMQISRTSDECCGADIIDTTTHVCCKGKQFDKTVFKICRDTISNECSAVNKMDECCGPHKLDTDSVCCRAGTNLNYRTFLTKKRKSSHNKCCTSLIKSKDSAVSYSDETEECLQRDEPTVTTIQSQPKCGSTYYNSNTDLCCYGNLYRNAVLDHKECCNYNVFDPTSQSCCVDRQVYNSTSCPDRPIVMCGATSYSRRSQICCGDQVHRKSPGLVCCGSEVIRPQTHGCCHAQVFTLQTQSCCRSQVVNSRSCDEEHPICSWLCEQNVQMIRRQIRRGKIDICKNYAYTAKIKHSNYVRNVMRTEIERSSRLYHDGLNPVKVTKLFRPTCTCDKAMGTKKRRTILVITDKSIRDRSVNLEDNKDIVLPYTKRVGKTLMKHWKKRCNTHPSPVSLVTADVVDEIFDFIKIKIEKQKKASFENK